MDNWGCVSTLVKDAAEYSAQTPNTLPVDFAMVGKRRALRITARPTPDRWVEVSLQRGFLRFFPDSLFSL